MPEELKILVKVDKETGQLKIATQEIDEFGKTVDKTSEKTSALSKQSKGTGDILSQLGSTIIPTLTATGIVSFFASAAQEAEKENIALRQLSFALSSVNVNFNNVSQGIQEWAGQMASATRFADDQLYEALAKLVRITGDLTSAQELSRVAMGISVKTGMDFNETVNLLGMTAQGFDRALFMLKRQFGSLLDGVKDNQTALKILQDHFRDAAIGEESYTRTIQETTKAWSEFKEEVGRGVIPAGSKLLSLFTDVIKTLRFVPTVLTGVTFEIIAALEYIGKVTKATTTFNFKNIGKLNDEFVRKVTLAREEMRKKIFEIGLREEKDAKGLIDKKVEIKTKATKSELGEEQERAKLVEKLEKGLTEATLGEFAKRKAELESDIKKAKELGLDKNLVARYMEVETTKILIDEEKKRTDTVAGLKDLSVKAILDKDQQKLAQIIANMDTEIEKHRRELEDKSITEQQFDQAVTDAVTTAENEKAAIILDSQLRILSQAQLNLEQKLQMIEIEKQANIAKGMSDEEAELRAHNARMSSLAEWFGTYTSTTEEMKKISNSVFTEMYGGFGKAMSGMIMHGKNFGQSMEETVTRMAEIFIEQIVAMIAKMIVLNALGSAFGIATGGIGGGIIGKILGLQEGGIVTKPTLAMVGEKRPEAVIPLERMGPIGRGEGHTFIFNGNWTMADKQQLRTMVEQFILPQIKNETIGRGI